MKPIAIAGVLLVVFGIVALAYQGLTYTTRDTVIDLGPIKATADRQHRIDIPPVLSGAAVAAGIVLLVVGTRKSS
jgi:hypothetical protein